MEVRVVHILIMGVGYGGDFNWCYASFKKLYLIIYALQCQMKMNALIAIIEQTITLQISTRRIFIK